MRRIWASGVVMALMLGGIAVAADDDQSPPSYWGHTGLYTHKDKPPPEKPPEKPKVDPEAKQSKISREHEDKALLRRLAVCDKLRAIAEATNDTELFAQANRLEDKVNILYQQRINRLVESDSDDKGPAPKATTVRSLSKDGADSTAGGREVKP